MKRLTMYQRAITLQQMADLFEGATLTGAIRTPAVWINTGTHPGCGAFTTLQDSDPEWIIVHSELPLDMPLPAHSTLAYGPSALAA